MTADWGSVNAMQRIRVTTSASGVRMQWLWWRTWQGLGTLAVILILAAFDLYQGSAGWQLAFLGGAAVGGGWVVYMSSLTVEADSDGVSFHRWFSPRRRCQWRDIADVTVQERINRTSRWPMKSYYCVLVLRSGRALRIDPGVVGRRPDDAAFGKEHIDQVRGLWDPSHV